jgi:hypothetical protein
MRPLMIELDLRKLNNALAQYGVSIRVAQGGDERRRDSREPSGPFVPDDKDLEDFVFLMSDLEHSLEFVGIGYFLNLMVQNELAPSVNDARTWFNALVEEGIIKVYKTDNKVEGRDQVSACSLNRDTDKVKDILGVEAE